LHKTEALLELLVTEGILRQATQQELKAADQKLGYFVTQEGLKKLPPETGDPLV
jgi:hypothetical protein